MKRAIDVKSTPAPGFLKGSGSVYGKKTLGFFGLRESVSFSVRRRFIDFEFACSTFIAGCGKSILW